MTKSELIERLGRAHPNVKIQDLEETVKFILERISLTLEKGDRVEVRGFGSFSLHQRDKRNGRNPKTGEAVKIKAKSIPYFRAGKELRDAVDHEV